MKMNKVFYILSVLCFTAFYSTFAVGAYSQDFGDLPLAEDIGIDLSVPLSPEDMTGVIDLSVSVQDEEIQLAHGGYGHWHSPAPLFVPYVGNVCRAGLSFCYTPAPALLGTPCHCIGYNFWGLAYIRFYGSISSY